MVELVACMFRSGRMRSILALSGLCIMEGLLGCPFMQMTLLALAEKA